MAKRFRRFSRKTRRSYRRRGFRGRKSLRSKVASINRRLAAEVKKNDNAFVIPLAEATGGFKSLTTLGLIDYAYMYPVFDATMKQGTQMDDIIGESIKMKYLYVGLHLQQLATGNVPVSLRVLVIQDRNFRTYDGGVPTVEHMFLNLFGYQVGSNSPYQGNIDVCLLPYNPLEPGRFRVLRDFRMTTAPGWRSDVYRRITIVQSRTNSHGKIYFGPKRPKVVYPVEIGVSDSSLYVDYAYGTVLPTIKLSNGDVLTPQSNGSATAYPHYVVSVGGNAGGQDNLFLSQYPGFGVTAVESASAGEPADQDITYTTSRNGIYVLILRQNSAQGTENLQPQGTLSIQSRFAYYDN